MSKSDIAVSVRGLSKSYTIRHQGQQHVTLAESLLARARHPFARSPHETFWALKDIEFDIKKGDVVGIIGRNGAGKSTLLKILSRITEPTTGQIDLYGRVGSLLEVGTGFHPELTGRENIFLNGAILGMTKAEIRKQFDAIVDFAGVEQFLDTPVKRYSSGMYVRLAFAVAAHLESEILIVDEVLSVGDAEFQRKCLGKMKEVASDGRTVLFVSHQMNAVRALCDRCMQIVGGKIERMGPSANVVDEYLANQADAETDWQNGGEHFVGAPLVPSRFMTVDTYDRPYAGPFRGDQPVHILIEGVVRREHIGLNVGVAVYATDDELLFWSTSTDRHPDHWPLLRRGQVTLRTAIPPHLLNEGTYRIELIVSLHHVEWISEPGRNAPSIALNIQGGLSESPYWLARRPGLLAPLLTFDSQPKDIAHIGPRVSIGDPAEVH